MKYLNSKNCNLSRDDWPGEKIFMEITETTIGVSEASCFWEETRTPASGSGVLEYSDS